jgi:hypothetical protein
LATVASQDIPGAVPRIDSTATPFADLRAVVVRLWGLALLAPGADLAVAKVLRSWARSAEQAPELRSALVSVLDAAAKTDRQSRILAFHARSWRDGKNLAPGIAEKLLEILERRSMR